jgi:hypothetical protein
MKGMVLTAVAVLLLATAIAPARAVTLADLIAGQSITVGDKLFDNFSYVRTGAAPTAAQITVLGDQDLNGNYGLRFISAWAASTPGQTMDSNIGFDVTVLDPNSWISDIHLTANLSATGDGSFAQVIEQVTDPDVVGQIKVETPKPLDARADLPKLEKKIHVSKDALFVVGKDGGNASMSELDNYYSQKTRVPEPGSIAMLLGVAVSGSLFGLRMRRARRA